MLKPTLESRLADLLTRQAFADKLGFSEALQSAIQAEIDSIEEQLRSAELHTSDDVASDNKPHGHAN